LTSLFSGRIKERTEKYIVVENACGLHQIPTNHIVEVSGAPEVNCENIVGKATCVLSVDGKFWLRIMGDKKY
jgi:hypothetical protein